jgi:colanic acid/amylovoran biosynthesis glycosyltransferase
VIRVLHSSTVWLAQTETWLHNQIRHLPKDVEAHVVCESTQNIDQFPVPYLHSLAREPAIRRLWDKGLRRLHVRRHLGLVVRVARRERCGVLHSHFGNVGWANLGAARAARLRHVVTFYGLDVNFLPMHDPRWRVRYRELFNSADRILCEGAHMASCIAALGCAAAKIQVHRLGIDLERVRYVPRRRSAGEPLRILIAAAFREKKGIPYALEAVARMSQGVPVEVALIGDADGSERSQREKTKILDVISRSGLGSRVRLLGYQTHSVLMEEAYRAHVFLAPSVTASDGDTEGGAPVSLIEMAASGMPVVSTRHCDIPGVIHHQVSGLLAEERNADEIAAHLDWLAEHPERWDPMVEEARRHVEAEFNAVTQGLRLAQIYRNLVLS